MVEAGFVKGWSDNLPEVDPEMVAFFFSNNPDFVSAEIGGAKATRASRQSYGEEAVGFVQLKRDNDTCIVKARITPEHKVTSPDYHVIVVINETEKTIERAECTSCVASKGGCKHVIAFVFWLHRKSMEPSVTSKTNYWKASKLSKAVRNKKYVKSCELGNKTPPPLPDIADDFRERFTARGTELGSKAMICNVKVEDQILLSTSLHHLAMDYMLEEEDEVSAEGFITFCKSRMTTDVCKKAEIATRGQDQVPLWNELRFARITASRAYQAAHCRTSEGALSEMIMGAAMPVKVEAMTRGRILEKKVLEVVEARMDVVIEKCGLFLSTEFPLLGASPDGITNDLCFEVKCPIKEKTVENYIKGDKITATPYAQMQLQMHFSNRKKCMFCVASPQFEENNEVVIKECLYNESYCLQLVDKCTEFWKGAIFNKLCSK